MAESDRLDGHDAARSDEARTCAREECSRPFAPRNVRQRYCSPNCRKRAYERRKFIEAVTVGLEAALEEYGF